MIQWTEDLRVGNKEIDNQHKELFVRIDKLVQAMSQGLGKYELTGVVDFLSDYVATHFRAEEAIMKNAGYPELGTHMATHRTYERDIAKIRAAVEANGASSALVIDVHKRVVDWLINHIGNSDKAFGKYLSSVNKQRAA